MDANIVKSPFPDIDIPEIPLHFWLFKKFSENVNNVALVDGITNVSYTYGELLKISKNVASGLAKMGLKKGDILAAYSRNSVEYIFIYLGVLAAGGVFTTVNPVCTKYYDAKARIDNNLAIISISHDELTHYLKSSKSRYIFCGSADLVQNCKDIANECNIKKIIIHSKNDGSKFETEDGMCQSFNILLHDNGSMWSKLETMVIRPREDVAVLLYSGGTTGLPKGVMLTHYSIVANRAQVQVIRLLEAQVARTEEAKIPIVLLVLPLYHSFGLMGGCTSNLFRGSKLIVLPSFQPTSFLNAIEKYKVAYLQIVPPIAMFLVQSPLVNAYDLSSVKKLHVSAAPLPLDIEIKLRDMFGIPEMRQGGYGMTELSGVVSINNPCKPVGPGSCGVPLPNTIMKVVDIETKQSLGPNEKGEILIKGPQRMKGYLDNKEATDKSFEGGFYCSGDIGYYDESRNFYIVDRIKELIKVKGYQVAPAELEALLLKHPDVQDVGVVGVPDKMSGELPRAYVVLYKGMKTTEKQLKEFVAEHLAPYKQLNGGVIFVNQIPKLESGKIMRRKLKEIALQSKL